MMLYWTQLWNVTAVSPFLFKTQSVLLFLSLWEFLKKVFLAYFMTLCSIYSDNNKFLYLFDFILYLVAWNNDTHVICVLQLL